MPLGCPRTGQEPGGAVRASARRGVPRAGPRPTDSRPIAVYGIAISGWREAEAAESLNVEVSVATILLPFQFFISFHPFLQSAAVACFTR